MSAAHRKLVDERMFRNWWFEYGEEASLGNEVRFEFEFEGATIVGEIDRIGPMPEGGTRITDYKTGNADNAPKAEESLQLGIYYLAVKESDDLQPTGPCARWSCAYLKGDWKGDTGWSSRRGGSTRTTRSEYQATVRESLAGLIALKRELNDTEVYRPNPTANCFWCDFKSLCPLFPEGAARRSTRRRRDEHPCGAGGGRRRHGRPSPPRSSGRRSRWPLEPYVLVAGAGSGKTSVMAARVVYLALGALGRVDAARACCPATSCA